jgi:hypothetical protein
MSSFTAISLLLRWLVALFGVFATYNPSGYSYYDWVRHPAASLSLQVLAGVVLVIFYVVYLRATLRSLGPIGISLTTALFGASPGCSRNGASSISRSPTSAGW